MGRALPPAEVFVSEGGFNGMAVPLSIRASDPGMVGSPDNCKGTSIRVRRMGLILGPVLASGMLAAGQADRPADRSFSGRRRRNSDGAMVDDGSSAVGGYSSCATRSLPSLKGVDRGDHGAILCAPSDLPVPWWLLDRKGDGAVAASSAACAPGCARRRARATFGGLEPDGLDGFSEHVGQQHGHGNGHGANRAVADRQHARANWAPATSRRRWIRRISSCWASPMPPRSAEWEH